MERRVHEGERLLDADKRESNPILSQEAEAL